jgi:hypothetical protein
MKGPTYESGIIDAPLASARVFKRLWWASRLMFGESHIVVIVGCVVNR